MITLTVTIITCDALLTTYSYPALPFLIDIPSIIEPGQSGLQHGQDIDLSLWGFSHHAPSFPTIELIFLVDALHCNCLLSPISAPIHQSTIFLHCFLADKYFRHHYFNMAMENSHIRWCFPLQPSFSWIFQPGLTRGTRFWLYPNHKALWFPSPVQVTPPSARGPLAASGRPRCGTVPQGLWAGAMGAELRC